MKNVFLGFSIVGAVIPYAFFVPFFRDNGVMIDTFGSALFVNGAASGFTSDLLISSFAFWAFLFWKKADQIWIYVLLNLTIGLSCALPFYFYRQVVAESQEL
jgi:hypothetical protein